MQGLTKFVKHIVGDVGDVIDWTLSNRFELLNQPIWRRRDLDTANNPRGIAGAKIGIENLD